MQSIVDYVICKMKLKKSLKMKKKKKKIEQPDKILKIVEEILNFN